MGRRSLCFPQAVVLPSFRQQFVRQGLERLNSQIVGYMFIEIAKDGPGVIVVLGATGKNLWFVATFGMKCVCSVLVRRLEIELF